jgi:DNA repair exonuclease SbcCD nuclease subunit
MANTKVALISDTHWGAHKGSKVFYSSKERYFKKELIPYLIKNEIKTLAFLGDIWDNREITNNKVQNIVYHIFEELANNNINVILLIGNHDTQYKTNIEYHSLKYVSLFPNVTVIDSITEMEIYDRKVTLFPWQTDELFTQVKYKGDIAFGHFDITGCLLNRNMIHEGGLNQGWFHSNFEKVFTGHFHTPGEYSNAAGKEIVYLGAPYHLNRNDIDSNRGIVILDMETLEYERVYSTTPLKYISVKYPEAVENIPIFNNIIDVHVSVTDKFKSNELSEYIYSIENSANGIPVNVNVIPHYDSQEVSIEEMDKEKLAKVKSIPDMVQLKLTEMDLDPLLKQSVNAYVSNIYENIRSI